MVEEEQTVNLTVPLRNPYVRRKLDIARFENVKSFGQDVTITFHDWEWRGGNNSKVIKKESYVKLLNRIIGVITYDS